MCRELGLHSLKLELPASTTQTELLSRVEELTAASAIHGILVQSPPPAHIDETAIVRALDPRKDVDGFSSGKRRKARAGRFQRLCPVHAAGRPASANRKQDQH